MAAFVGQIVPAHHLIGSTGFGPSWFVLLGAGGGVEQVSLIPQPKFRSDAVRFGSRLTSSLQFGPFSVTYGRPVTGWKARPNMFRCPYVYTYGFQLAFVMNGLSDGGVPSVFIRRTFPIGLIGFCASAIFAFSPTTAYNFLSGPNAMTPPLWFVRALRSGSRRMVVFDIPEFPFARIRTIRL